MDHGEFKSREFSNSRQTWHESSHGNVGSRRGFAGRANSDVSRGILPQSSRTACGDGDADVAHVHWERWQRRRENRPTAAARVYLEQSPVLATDHEEIEFAVGKRFR